MASPAGNPNPNHAGFLFRPPNVSGATTAAGVSTPSPLFAPPSSYTAAQSPAGYSSPPNAMAGFSYPPSAPPFHQNPAFLFPHDPFNRPQIVGSGIPNPSPNPGSGARLMALLNQQPQLESSVSMPPSTSLPSDFGSPPSASSLHPVPSAPSLALVQPSQPMPARMPSSKLPRGRLLVGGDRAVYDVDSRLPGEVKLPQLEVTPITKYISDPGLVLGRQIAVNKTYICYGLKLGTIRVLNSNTALRALLKGHTQMWVTLISSKKTEGSCPRCQFIRSAWVTDMAFFAEDVHILASVSIDGRIFVWKIDEGPDEESKSQICGKVVTAMHFVGDAESCHPRICWHSHKQEIFFVGIGNRVLRIDITRVGRGKEFSVEEPLKCPLDKLIEGVQLIGKHDGEVTDLSISQWMLTRLASASKDGTVTIWDDRKASPLVTLRPHDGDPVASVEFMTSPHQPDHINLITAGSLNREVKIWASGNEEGWLLPSDSESWRCTQILDLRSSMEPSFEEAFFNQVVVLPQASLIVIANAKKNAIYAVHVDYGPNPASTCMDYIADFAVAMPILSLIGTTYNLPDGEQVVQLYCVQTQAIQQYALDLAQCLPAPTANPGSGKGPLSRVLEASSAEVSTIAEPVRVLSNNDIHLSGVASQTQLAGTSVESTSSYPITSLSADITCIHELPTSNIEVKLTLPGFTSGNPEAMSSSSSSSLPIITGKLPTQGNSREGSSVGKGDIDLSGFESSTDSTSIFTIAPDITTSDSTRKDEPKTGQNPRLITPFEILSGVLPPSKNNYVRQNSNADKINSEIKENLDVEAVNEGKPSQQETDSGRGTQNNLFEHNRGLSWPSEVENERTTIVDSSRVEETLGAAINTTEFIEPSSAKKDGYQDITRNASEKVIESAFTEVSGSAPTAKGRKQEGKQYQTSGPSSPSASPFNSIDSLNVPRSSSSHPPIETALPQVLAMQDMLNQLIGMQKEMQKQMAAIVSGPVTKEGKRVETALGRSMEKAIRANVDALWVRIQEEHVKHEKVEKEYVQQVTSLITNSMNKELPAMLEKTLKKEISAVGPIVARSISPIVSSTIAESFQRGVGDKAVNQLEKSVTSKIEAAVAKQIQTSFQTSGKQVLQEVLKSSLDSSVIPAFDRSCKGMFEQIDNSFQKGMSEHTAAAQQKLEAAHTPLVLALHEAIHSASSITQNLSNELIDGQHKLLALVATGNSKVLNPTAIQQTNGPLAGLPEIHVEAPVDPTKGLSRLISDLKYEEAFTVALQRSDVSIVSWLCTQVDLHAICSTLPLPLSQGVLLALLQQLACDINNDTSKKVIWMTDVAVAINPADPMIAQHVRPIFQQVYNIVDHQRSLLTTKPSEAANIRLIMHVINSVLMSCK